MNIYSAYILLFFLAVLQNMAFTWVSRSRNSGDVWYHGLAAIFSNGAWFIMTVFLWNSLWKTLTEGAIGQVMMTGVVYVAGTVVGSMLMMKWCLKFEKGKRKVGATEDCVSADKSGMPVLEKITTAITAYSSSGKVATKVICGRDIARELLALNWCSYGASPEMQRNITAHGIGAFAGSRLFGTTLIIDMGRTGISAE
jgi:hypothetical protein